MNKPHKHAELIKAWADGAEIQKEVSAKSELGETVVVWEEELNPEWYEFNRYRIKPREFEEGAWYPVKTLTDVSKVCVFKHGAFSTSLISDSYPIESFSWIGEKLEIQWPEELSNQE